MLCEILVRVDLIEFSVLRKLGRSLEDSGLDSFPESSIAIYLTPESISSISWLLFSE